MPVNQRLPLVYRMLDLTVLPLEVNHQFFLQLLLLEYEIDGFENHVHVLGLRGASKERAECALRLAFLPRRALSLQLRPIRHFSDVEWPTEELFCGFLDHWLGHSGDDDKNARDACQICGLHPHVQLVAIFHVFLRKFGAFIVTLRVAIRKVDPPKL